MESIFDEHARKKSAAEAHDSAGAKPHQQLDSVFDATSAAADVIGPSSDSGSTSRSSIQSVFEEAKQSGVTGKTAHASKNRRNVWLLCGTGVVGAICVALMVYHPPQPPHEVQREVVVQQAEQAMNAGDFAQAANLLKQGSSREAKFELACLYKNGLGVEQDTEMAVSLLTAAADKGLPLAQTMLGIWTANGDGVQASPSTAVAWYLKAVAQGDPNAAELIGLAYAGGDGVAQNNAKAYMWFTVASKLGNSDGDSQRGLIGNMLETAQKEQAEKDAQSEFEHGSGGRRE